MQIDMDLFPYCLLVFMALLIGGFLSRPDVLFMSKLYVAGQYFFVVFVVFYIYKRFLKIEERENEKDYG